jgi:hypothetical protein
MPGTIPSTPELDPIDSSTVLTPRNLPNWLLSSVKYL